MSDQEDAPKLHIDADWKASAQAEKERLKQQEASKQSEQGEQKIPEASFQTLVDTMAYQAISGLGVFADKESGGVMVDLPFAKMHIDLLGVIEEKTKGNLTDEESSHLKQVLDELRSRFVQIAQIVEQQSHNQSTAAQATPTNVQMPESPFKTQ